MNTANSSDTVQTISITVKMMKEDKRFKRATPEECGISSRKIEKMLRKFEDYEYLMHGMLVARGDKIFFEKYWKPFDEETHHRMNSVL